MPTAFSRTLRVLSAMLILLSPSTVFACACGCGVFDVSTPGMLPTQAGGMAWLEYNFMNQNKNWHGTASAPAADNDDKDLKSQFFTAGAQYMFNRDWGAQMTVPFTDRHFVTFDEDSATIARSHRFALGDVKVEGIYSCFSADMSSGVTFGLKLPTGDYTYRGFDRDTEIGSGSTDLLLGGYHMGNLAGRWDWFGNTQLDQPMLIRGGYRPGAEGDASLGVYYNGWRIGSVRIAPIAQLVGSYRLQDRGPAANPGNSGYQRLLLSPGFEINAAGLRIDGDVGFPVYQRVRGDQLAASQLLTLSISRSF